MSLPAAVQRNLDNADAFLNAANSAVPPDQPVDTLQHQPQTPVPQAASSGQAAPQVSEETWEARFQTLSGKYNAEVPRLAQQVRENQSLVQTLVAENQALSTANKPVIPQAQPFTDSERDAFGPDLVDLIDRVSKTNSADAKAAAERSQAENLALRRQLENVQEQQTLSAKDRFLQKLTTAVPDWTVVNADRGFLQWLGETDPVYGLPRQAGLDNAYQALDVDRMARIFETYKTLAGVPARNRQAELQSQVAPTSSRGSSVPMQDPSQGKIWTQAEISAVYADGRRGHIDAETADRLYKEIDAAVADGRVR